jgi:hypothetical protein
MLDKNLLVVNFLRDGSKERNVASSNRKEQSSWKAVAEKENEKEAGVTGTLAPVMIPKRIDDEMEERKQPHPPWLEWKDRKNGMPHVQGPCRVWFSKHPTPQGSCLA